MRQHLYLIYEAYTTDFAEVEDLVGPYRGRIRRALMVRVAQSFDDEFTKIELQIAYAGRDHIGTYSLAKGSEVIVNYESSEVRFTHHESQYLVRIPKGRILGTEIGAVHIVAPRRARQL